MWKWLKKFGRYFSEKLNKFLGRGETLDTVADLQKPPASVVDQLGRWAASGQIDAAAWEAQMREQIKYAYIQQYLLGRGGRGAMTQADWGSIGGMLKEQYGHLSEFAKLIADGKLSEAQILARSRMYINSSREAFERAKQRVALGLGLTEEMWVLNPQSENCEQCVGYADDGWWPVSPPDGKPHYPIPGDGSTTCMTNCTCHKLYRNPKNGYVL